MHATQTRACGGAYIVVVLLIVELAAAHNRCWGGVALALALIVCGKQQPSVLTTDRRLSREAIVGEQETLWFVIHDVPHLDGGMVLGVADV